MANPNPAGSTDALAERQVDMAGRPNAPVPNPIGTNAGANGQAVGSIPGGLPVMSPRPQFQSASLYVGDLAPEVNESHLYEVFNSVAPVASMRVCRNAVTRESLGYAYVNFNSAIDAERVLDTMNYTPIKGKQCRIMWSHRDPSLRKNGRGNVFIKNLDENIDHKALHDTFSIFGNILSCKVAFDKNTGKSKGYGFVHYETAEEAKDAIEKVNGMMIGDREVFVAPWQRHADRVSPNQWTNVYVKNIPLDWDIEKLKEVFTEAGEITSVTIMTNPDQTSKGFGFVNFKEHESAEAAIKIFNGKIVATVEDDAEEEATKEKEEDAKKSEDGEKATDGKSSEEKKGGEKSDKSAKSGRYSEEEIKKYRAKQAAKEGLFVCRAQKRSERDKQLRMAYEKKKAERLELYAGKNLYIKNIHENVTEELLRKHFEDCGTIMSATLMRDEPNAKKHRGFGFVCMSSPEEATKAVQEKNQTMLMGKPLYVAIAQSRFVRRNQMRQRFQNMRGGMGPRVGGPLGAGPGAMGMMNPMFPYQQNPQMAMMMAQMRAPMQQGLGPRGSAFGMPMGYNMNSMLQAQQPGQPGGPQGPQGQGSRGGRGAGRNNANNMNPNLTAQQQQQQILMMQQQAMRGPMGQQMPMGQGQRGGQPPMNVQMQQQMQGAPQQGLPAQGGMPGQQQQTQQVNAGSQQNLTQSLLMASAEDQKNIIGERLYPLIRDIEPEQAGKVTGMLLEAMETSELINLLESPEDLTEKVQEAVDVLDAHKAKQQQ
eukprot:g4070.t1